MSVDIYLLGLTLVLFLIQGQNEGKPMVITYLLALLIGLLLGLLGGGGSILTVPVFVYLAKMPAKEAIASSLAVVGVVSFFGLLMQIKKKNVDFQVALIFSPVAMIGTYTGAKLSVFISGQVQLLLFAVMMLITAVSMLRKKKEPTKPKKLVSPVKKYALIITESLLVGIFTGIVGVGGGFLIVPVLTLLMGLDIKKAVGTSLLIISLKSFSGFYGYWGQVNPNWEFLGIFSTIAVIGIISGIYLLKFISQQHLKKAFAIFLIVVGSWTLYKNL